MKRVEKETIITARGLVEEERQRLLDVPNKPDFKSWLGDRSFPLLWMKEQFGETLKEKDGLIYPNGSRFNEADCDVCGKEVEPDEKVIHLKFNSSFCDGYDFDLKICRGCLVRLNKLTKDKK